MATAGRFNPNHAPAGSATGGQFAASGGGSSNSGKSGSGKGGTPKAMDAHQKHLAHKQYLANHPDTPGARAERKAALLEEIKADKAKIAVLEKQLAGLKQQQAKAAQAAKHTRAAAASAKGGPNQKKTLAHAAAVSHRKHASVKQQAASTEEQIAALQAQVKADTAEAAKL